jgi:hypothetical protein
MKVMTVSLSSPALLPQWGEGRFVSRIRDFHIKHRMYARLPLFHGFQMPVFERTGRA